MSLLSFLPVLVWSIANACFMVYLNRRKRRLIRFAVKAWRQRNKMREIHEMTEGHWKSAYEEQCRETTKLALERRRTWTIYEVQEALALAQERLLAQRPSQEEQRVIDKVKAAP